MNFKLHNRLGRLIADGRRSVSLVRPNIYRAGARVGVQWPGREPIFLEPEEALQLVSDRRVVDDLKFAAREVQGFVTRGKKPVDGEEPISER